MSEAAVGPLDPSTMSSTMASTNAFVSLRTEIRDLENELRELERCTQEAERRLEAEDLASPFARRSFELGDFLALEIVRHGRADIRGLLAEARVAADGRLADALREANEVLEGARVEVALALEDRASVVETILRETPGLAQGDDLDAIVAARATGPSAAGAGAMSIVPTVVPDERPPWPGTELDDAESGEDPGAADGVRASTRPDPMAVVGLLEASIATSHVVPMGSPVDAAPVRSAGLSPAPSPPPASVPSAAPIPLPEPPRDSAPASAAILVGLPNPPDPVEAVDAPEAIDRGFADLADLGGADPFAGDTPATTSEHIEALADLGVTTPAGAPGMVESDAHALDDRAGAGFWGEQEAARRMRWLRPVEILVPMVLALLLFVVLLLWIG